MNGSATVIRNFSNEQVYLEKRNVCRVYFFFLFKMDNGKAIQRVFMRVYGIDFTKEGGCRY